MQSLKCPNAQYFGEIYILDTQNAHSVKAHARYIQETSFKHCVSLEEGFSKPNQTTQDLDSTSS